MKNPPLVKTLCEQYCAFYKPGKNEELACKGFAVMERLMLAHEGFACQRYEQGPDKSVLDMVVQKMCMKCDFHAQDCDFIQDRTARPCGGFVLISQLLGSGEISLEEIT